MPSRVGALTLGTLSTILAASYRADPRAADGPFRPPVRCIRSSSIHSCSTSTGPTAGVYHYDPYDHCSSCSTPISAALPAAFVDASVAEQASLIVVITGVFWRSRFKYGARGYRFTLLEAGHAAQNALLAAAALGLDALPLGAFYDTRLEVDRRRERRRRVGGLRDRVRNCRCARLTAAELDHVSKSYGSNHALDDVSFTPSEGSIVAVLGPNGAGKSTALALVLGLRRADGGNVSLFGRNPTSAADAKSGSGRRPRRWRFPATLRVVEIVEFVRAHFPQPLDTADVLERVRLTRLAHRQAGGLSGGERRRLAVAIAFAGSPRLVVLDEPTSGLDVESRRGLWDVIREFATAGGAVLLTTHQLEEAEELASSIVVLHRSRVAAHGTRRGDPSAQAGLGRVRIRAQPLPDGLGDRVEHDRDHVTIYARDPADVVRELVRVGARLDGLEVSPLPLEDALQALARRGRAMRLATRPREGDDGRAGPVPAYVVPTLGFPTMFFLFFVASYGEHVRDDPYGAVRRVRDPGRRVLPVRRRDRIRPGVARGMRTCARFPSLRLPVRRAHLVRAPVRRSRRGRTRRRRARGHSG